MSAHIVTAAIFSPATTRSHLAKSGDPIFGNPDNYPQLDPLPYSNTRSSLGAQSEKSDYHNNKKGGGSSSSKNAQDMIIVVADGEHSPTKSVSTSSQLTLHVRCRFKLRRESSQFSEIRKFPLHYSSLLLLLLFLAHQLLQQVQSFVTTIRTELLQSLWPVQLLLLQGKRKRNVGVAQVQFLTRIAFNSVSFCLLW